MRPPKLLNKRRVSRTLVDQYFTGLSDSYSSLGSLARKTLPFSLVPRSLATEIKSISTPDINPRTLDPQAVVSTPTS
jgi:hypothetical protein